MSGTDDDYDPGRGSRDHELHNNSEPASDLMREGSHLRTPAYRPQRYAVGENSTVCVKRVMFWRSDGISDSWINSVI